MRVAYCDCFSGISGDMFLAALLDAGLPIECIHNSLYSLGWQEEVSLKVEKVKKGELQSTFLVVEVKDTGRHSHRHYPDIVQMIEDSSLSVKTKKVSLSIFEKLAVAEAEVHGSTIDQVHFHEVGAVDSILDIIGASVGLEHFHVERLFSSPVPMSSGKVETQHGILPLPSPATLQLLSMSNAKVVPSEASIELVTPTGAAILSALATFEQPSMSIERIGTGAGKHDLPWPNIFRFILGESQEYSGQSMTILETNIDDMNPQTFGYVMDKLFAAGALDVYFTPIQMKKNRPATMLSILAKKVDEPALAQLVLRETSTFGVRAYPISRYEAHREIVIVKTQYGEIPVKMKYLEGEEPQGAPEFEICAKLAREHNVPLSEIYHSALSCLNKSLID